MLSLDEIIKEAENAPREHADIEVIFHSGIAKDLEAVKQEQADLEQQLDDIDTSLAAELEQLGKDRRAGDGRPVEARQRADAAAAPIREALDALTPRLEDIERRAAEFLVTFRITALHQFEWDELTSRSMPRDGYPLDAAWQYNVDEVTQVALTRSAVRVGPDDTVIDVTKEQWDGIWKTVPSLGRNQFRNAVYYLNQWAMTAAKNEAVVAARKVSTAQQANTQPSPSDSGSTLDVSAGGNRRSSRTTSGKTAA